MNEEPFFKIYNELEFEFFHKMKDYSYIYVLYDNKGKILYVGQTKSLFTRLSQHCFVMDKAKKCKVYVVENKDATEAENFFMHKLKPSINKKIPNFYSYKKENSDYVEKSLHDYLYENRITITDFCYSINYSRNPIQSYLSGKSRLGKKAAKIIHEATDGVVSYSKILKDNPDLSYKKRVYTPVEATRRQYLLELKNLIQENKITRKECLKKLCISEEAFEELLSFNKKIGSSIGHRISDILRTWKVEQAIENKGHQKTYKSTIDENKPTKIRVHAKVKNKLVNKVSHKIPPKKRSRIS